MRTHKESAMPIKGSLETKLRRGPFRNQSISHLQDQRWSDRC